MRKPEDRRDGEPLHAPAAVGVGWRGGHNPPWSREETLLLLDLHRRAPGANAAHPEVVALSVLLNQAARVRGDAPLPSFRNPPGVAARLRSLARLDPHGAGSSPPARPPTVMDAAIWREFGSDRDGLSRESDRIRGAIAAAPAGRPDETSPTPSDVTAPARSSHGPRPFTGVFETTVEAGAAVVYVLALRGPVAGIMPSVAAGGTVMKIGRSSDVRRRAEQLNAGFPPGLAIRWEPLAAFDMVDGDQAHEAERLLLDQADAEGWSIGGEFIIGDEILVLQVAEAILPTIGRG